MEWLLSLMILVGLLGQMGGRSKVTGCGLAFRRTFLPKKSCTFFCFSAAGRWGGVHSEELGDSERSPRKTGGEGGRISEGGGSVRAAEAPEESEGQNPAEWIHPGPDQQLPPRSQTGQWNKVFHASLFATTELSPLWFLHLNKSCLRYSSN